MMRVVAPARPLTFIHLAPHPDDEAIAAPATLLALRAAGHRVVNLACSLGRPEQSHRRLREVREACRRGGFELVVHDPPLGLSLQDDRAGARAALTASVARLVEAERAAVVIAPSPHDRHHGHETVGRAAVDAVEALAVPPRLWLWSLWADLPLPTLYVEVGRRRMRGALRVLAAHRGELRRTDYRALVRGRARANRVLGSERVFGFGEPMRGGPYAELLTEAVLHDGAWWSTAARTLDPRAPLCAADARRHPLGWWLRSPSFTDRLGDAATG